MTQTNTELTPKQLIVASYLGRGCTNTEVSEKCNVSRKTIDRWMVKPGFKEEIYNQSLEFIRESYSASSGKMNEIADTLWNKLLKWAQEIDLDSMSHSSIIRLMSEVRNLAETGLSTRDRAWGIDQALTEYFQNESED